AQFEGLVRLAGDHEGYLEQVRLALAEVDDGSLLASRQAFAARQTWLHRAEALDDALSSISEPLISIVVLTYNNLGYTKQCLHSLEVNTDYENVEIIVVDNASSDDSPAYLAEWEQGAANRRFIANQSNLGFSAGNNVGLDVARGDYLVVLNNDTYVTPGWLRTLRNQLRRRADAGLVGPVTNNIGNEAKIQISYESMDQMVELAGRYTRANAGRSFEIATSAFFCVMISRQAYTVVGGLDEQFGVGFFEDDDYCRRLEQAGLVRLCAEDVFVHHHLSASFNKLKAEAKQALFEKNKALYEAKWGKWSPHGYRS
ncbi:MAG TPA: glycosyl transferase, partial [Stenotrophomonas sp.]|nr:glycosyl transferase [Stenotrophomonas sp.]